MEIKVKNYVIKESKTFTYTLKNVTKTHLISIIEVLIKNGFEFQYHCNRKSNVLSFYVIDLDMFCFLKEFFRKKGF